MVFQSPVIVEPIVDVSIVCPKYEGTNLYLRCVIAFSKGSSVSVVINYGDRTTETIPIQYSKKPVKFDYT